MFKQVSIFPFSEMKGECLRNCKSQRLSHHSILTDQPQFKTAISMSSLFSSMVRLGFLARAIAVNIALLAVLLKTVVYKFPEYSKKSFGLKSSLPGPFPKEIGREHCLMTSEAVSCNLAGNCVRVE